MIGAMGNRGTALIAALIIIMILLPLGAYVALQCRSDLLIERNFRAEVEAFYAAEAGLEHAIAEIDPGLSFDAVLAGPDGIPGTADDGAFPFRHGPPGDFAPPQLSYEVRSTPVTGNMLSLVSRGTGRYGATKVVAALVARSPIVFTPAALYVQGGIRSLDLGGGTLLLSGLDHRVDDPSASPTGTAAPIAALASTDAEGEQDLRQRLPEGLAARLSGAGGAPSIATSPTFDVQGYADRFAAQSSCVHLSALGETLTLGTPGTPQVSVVEGDAYISGWLRGNGVLVVRGTLDVAGAFEFTGLVVALNGILFEPTGNITITGTLWRGPAMDERLWLRGSGAIEYSSSALSAVDTAFPGILPHPAVVNGWEEQL
jgi:hypothetical protein